MMAFMLSIWCVPIALAEEGDGENIAFDTSQIQSETLLQNGTAEEESQVLGSSGEESNIEVNGDSSSVELLDEGACSPSGEMAAQSVANGSYAYQADLEQLEQSTIIRISFPNIASFVETGKVDRIVLNGEMKYGDTITRSVSADKAFIDLNESNYHFDLDFETYGKFSISVAFYKGDILVKNGDVQTLGIVADEYNIAPISASLPVAFFSLSLWGASSIRFDSAGNTIPTIMLMERPNAWNWDALPDGVYPIPYLSEEEVAYQPSDFGAASNLFREHSKAMSDYVGDLYEMNPKAKFNLYLVDYYLGLIQSVLYANGIPQSQYSITVLSDGSFSYQRFGAVYNGADPEAAHQSLEEAWVKSKEEAYSTGTVSDGYNLWECNDSLYAAVDVEPNAQWWLARPALLESKGDSNVFGGSAQKDNQVVRVYIDRKLSALQAEGDNAIAEFKALYNFSDTYFSDAEAAGKDVMLFLGTTVGSEAGSFSDYARFTMAYYGDNYEYYYKGHPGSPTEFYDEKISELEALGIEDIDSSIAAELILFFYPDIYLSGYPSSTYASISNPDMAKGMFRITKASAMTNESYALMDWWISPVADNTDEKIKALCKSGDSNYLVEFSDGQMSVLDYTIAIWNSTTSTVSYYLLQNDEYVFVRSAQSGGNLVDGGVYTLGSKSSLGRSIDIDAGSLAAGANVQIYDENESFAQRFRLEHVGGGYYTIQNAKSGKMLDVEGAAVEPGANVHQWNDNGSDAQKWKLVETGDGDGSFYIVSKCNGLYLDQQWGQTKNGTNIWVYTGNGSNAQKFYLNKVMPEISDGTYVVSSGVGEQEVLDIAGASNSNGANAQLYDWNGTKAQQFLLEYDASTGYYSIENVGSSKNLETKWGGSSQGTNVWQYEANGSAAQSWSIKASDDGMFILYSATGAGCCLDVSGGSSAKGANVQVWNPNGTVAQKWNFKSVA